MHGSKSRASQQDNSQFDSLDVKEKLRIWVSGAFLISFILIWFQTRSAADNTDLRWKVWVTIGLAGASTFATQACELPIQNVILAAAVIGLAGAVGGTVDELACAKLMLQSKILG